MLRRRRLSRTVSTFSGTVLVNIGAGQSITQTIGPDTHSYTVPMASQAFQFIDETWAVVLPEGGQSITEWSPAPVSRVVTDYPGTVGAKEVDGSEVFGAWPFSIIDQGIDERQLQYVSGLRPSAPLTFTPGKKLLTVKSLDVPPSTSKRESIFSSACCLTSLDAVPADLSKKYYRPGLFADAANVTTANLIPQFPIASFPELAEPPALDMEGAAVTFDWSVLDNSFGYDPLCSYGFFRMGQVQTYATYEAWGTKHGFWYGTGPDNAYNNDSHLRNRFLRQRIAKTSNAAAQKVIDQIIEYTLDWDSLMEKAKAAGVTNYNAGASHGGHVPTIPHLLLIGAWALTVIGGTVANTIAQRAYDRIMLDAPDILPHTHRECWVHSKEFTAANRANSNWHTQTSTLGTSATPDTTVHFGTLDWNAEGLVDTDTNDRMPQELVGAEFTITSGAAAGDTIYRVVGYTFDPNGYDGVGGDGWLVSPNFVNKTPPSSGDSIAFICVSDEEIDWCNNFYGGPVVGHVPNSNDAQAVINNNWPSNAFPRMDAVYAQQNVVQQRTAAIAMHGLECSLWSGGAETLTFNVRTKYFFERLRSTGPTLYNRIVGDSYDTWTPSTEALTRHYFHGDEGFPDWDLYPGYTYATAPILTSLGGDASVFMFTTDYPWHRAYYVVTTSATGPSAAQVRAGLDHAGVAATLSGSVAITSRGETTINHSLPAGTYYLHVIQDTPSDYPSAVTSSTAVVV